MKYMTQRAPSELAPLYEQSFRCAICHQDADGLPNHIILRVAPDEMTCMAPGLYHVKRHPFTVPFNGIDDVMMAAVELMVEVNVQGSLKDQHGICERCAGKIAERREAECVEG